MSLARLLFTALFVISACRRASPPQGSPSAAALPPSPSARQGTLSGLPLPKDTLRALPGGIKSITSFVRQPDSAGQRRFRIVNARFLVPRLYLRYRGLLHPLLRETVDQTCCSDGERESWATITLDGWQSEAQAADAPSWTVRLQADEGNLWGQFYRAVLRGCCDETDALTYVNVQTGATAFVTSADTARPESFLAHLDVPNSSLERWAGFLDTYSGAEVPEAHGDSGVVGILEYGTGLSPAARYVVRLSSYPGYFYRLGSVELTADDSAHTHGANLSLWSANGQEDPKALSRFWISVILVGREMDDREAPDVTIRLPVEADSVRPDRARLPSGWSIRPAGTGR